MSDEMGKISTETLNDGAIPFQIWFIFQKVSCIRKYNILCSLFQTNPCFMTKFQEKWSEHVNNTYASSDDLL